MRCLYKRFLLPLFIGICSVFSGIAWADKGHVWELVKASFPQPNFIIKPDVEKSLPVPLPPFFRSGHGEFKNSAATGLTVGFVDTDDPLGR